MFARVRCATSQRLEGGLLAPRSAWAGGIRYATDVAVVGDCRFGTGAEMALIQAARSDVVEVRRIVASGVNVNERGADG